MSLSSGLAGPPTSTAVMTTPEGAVRVDATSLSLVSLKQLITLCWVAEPVMTAIRSRYSSPRSQRPATGTKNSSAGFRADGAGYWPLRTSSQLALRGDLGSREVGALVPPEMARSVPWKLAMRDGDGDGDGDNDDDYEDLVKRLAVLWLARHREQLQAFIQRPWAAAEELRCALALVSVEGGGGGGGDASSVETSRSSDGRGKGDMTMTTTRWAVEFRHIMDADTAPSTSKTTGCSSFSMEAWTSLCLGIVLVASGEPAEFGAKLRRVLEFVLYQGKRSSARLGSSGRDMMPLIGRKAVGRGRGYDGHPSALDGDLLGEFSRLLGVLDV